MYWPRLATALLIAVRVWGPPACGTPNVVYATAPASEPAGWAYPALSCTIFLNDRYRVDLRALPEWRCAVIVHEWGHLTGHMHSPDPRNIMYANADSYWRCERPLERRLGLAIDAPTL